MGEEKRKMPKENGQRMGLATKIFLVVFVLSLSGEKTNPTPVFSSLKTCIEYLVSNIF